jgi:hypothetical protein
VFPKYAVVFSESPHVLSREQAEEALTRGTPVTIESFKTWKAKFDKEMLGKKSKEEEEKLKGMTPKEREEYKRVGTRLTGTDMPLASCFSNTVGANADHCNMCRSQAANSLNVTGILRQRTTLWQKKARPWT